MEELKKQKPKKKKMQTKVIFGRELQALMVYFLVKGDFHFVAQLLLWMKTLIVQNPEYLTDFSQGRPLGCAANRHPT